MCVAPGDTIGANHFLETLSFKSTTSQTTEDILKYSTQCCACPLLPCVASADAAICCARRPVAPEPAWLMALGCQQTRPASTWCTEWTACVGPLKLQSVCLQTLHRIHCLLLLKWPRPRYVFVVLSVLPLLSLHACCRLAVLLQKVAEFQHLEVESNPQVMIQEVSCCYAQHGTQSLLTQHTAHYTLHSDLITGTALGCVW